ncbi:MAG: hypothetical protein NTY65_18195 [Planctomycetota bacterium]|nr:hypothetical protein [Planctomycetota bacterium]
MRADLVDVGRIGIEAVDQVTVASAQGGRQPPVAAAEVDDQAALDVDRLKNLLRQGLLGGGGNVCAEHKACTRAEDAEGQHSCSQKACVASVVTRHRTLPVLRSGP